MTMAETAGGGTSVALIAAIGALIGVVITAVFSVIATIVTQNLTRQREDRTKRIQLSIDHAEKQLSEFYSPLLALAVLLDQTATESQMIDLAPTKDRPDINKIMWEDIYRPIHSEILNILKTKIHLIEGFDINKAQGFKEYLRHYASQQIYWQLLNKGHALKYDTYAYQELFNQDVSVGLSTVSKRYENSLEELRKPPTPERYLSWWAFLTSRITKDHTRSD
jgi:hypothetical protein